MSNIDAMYTWSEKNVKKYTVYQAIQSAKRRLEANRRWDGSVNVTAVRGRPDNTKITLQELNEIQEAIYFDSLDR